MEDRRDSSPTLRDRNKPHSKWLKKLCHIFRYSARTRVIIEEKSIRNVQRMKNPAAGKAASSFDLLAPSRTRNQNPNLLNHKGHEVNTGNRVEKAKPKAFTAKEAKSVEGFYENRKKVSPETGILLTEPCHIPHGFGKPLCISASPQMPENATHLCRRWSFLISEHRRLKNCCSILLKTLRNHVADGVFLSATYLLICSTC